MAKAIVLSAAFQPLVLAAPLYIQLVVDRSLSQGDAEVLLPLAAGFSLLIVLRGAVAWMRV